MKLWDASTGEQLRSLEWHKRHIKSVAISPNGQFVLSGSADGSANLWDFATGKDLRLFAFDYTEFDDVDEVYSVAFAPDGRSVIAGGANKPPKIWELDKVKWPDSFKRDPTKKDLYYGDYAVAFSKDSRFVLSGNSSGPALWDVASRMEIPRFASHGTPVGSVGFSLDGSQILVRGDRRYTFWSRVPGRRLSAVLGGTTNALSSDHRLLLPASYRELRLLETATGRQLKSILTEQKVSMDALAFSPDSRLAASGGEDGSVKIWGSGSWQRTTKPGPWRRSCVDNGVLPRWPVRPCGGRTGQCEATKVWEVTGKEIGRFALPPTVAGEVEFTSDSRFVLFRASEGGFHVADKVLDAGPPPDAAIISPSSQSRVKDDVITVAARITDRGSGIGRIEWRVNGVTTAVRTPTAEENAESNFEQTLALDPGANTIEVIAYERRNILASLPTRTSAALDAATDRIKPTLHILAIGINDYTDKGWTPPGSSDTPRFPPLRLAANDAKSFVAKMQKAGSGLYGDVRVAPALDSQAAKSKLHELVEDLARKVHPRDTFVLFATAHGYSTDGRFYLIPQDFQGGPDPQALASRAIGQDHLQD